MSWQENRETVQRYNEALGALEKPFRAKVDKFIHAGCIEQVYEGKLICKPLHGYNITTYRIDFIPMTGKYICSCQGYKTNSRCSHIEALKVKCKMDKIEFHESTQLSFL